MGEPKMARRPRKCQPLEPRLEYHTAYDELTGCWIWLGNIHWNGYGRIHVDNVPRLVHHVSYELRHGPIPAGLVLRHTCDVRSCRNPDHLVPGTKADNTADMMERGRAGWLARPRADNPAAKLTQEDADHIRQRVMSIQGYAELYGVHRATISGIVNGRTWRDDAKRELRKDQATIQA